MTIIKTPRKPIIIAIDLLIPSVSPKTGTAMIAAKIGAEWTIATFSDNNKYFNGQSLYIDGGYSIF